MDLVLPPSIGNVFAAVYACANGSVHVSTGLKNVNGDIPSGVAFVPAPLSSAYQTPIVSAERELALLYASPCGCSSRPFRRADVHQLSSAPKTRTFAITYSHTRRITGGPNVFSTGFRLV